MCVCARLSFLKMVFVDRRPCPWWRMIVKIIFCQFFSLLFILFLLYLLCKVFEGNSLLSWILMMKMEKNILHISKTFVVKYEKKKHVTPVTGVILFFSKKRLICSYPISSFLPFWLMKAVKKKKNLRKMMFFGSSLIRNKKK